MLNLIHLLLATKAPGLISRLTRVRIVLAGLIATALACVPSATATPVIHFVYPSVINERAGDHVAFQVSASGTGTLSYQWYQANTLLAGQTGSALVLTNIQTDASGQYEISVEDSSGISVTNAVTLNVSTNALPLYPTNLVVLRVGDGPQPLSGSTGNTIYLDQYTTSGTYVSSMQVPDESAGGTYGAGSSSSVYGSPALLLPGAGYDYFNGGRLTLSPNQQLLSFGAYCENYPFSGADVTTAVNGGPYWRGLAVVNAAGECTLAYTNGGLYTGASDKGNSGANHSIRSCVTVDGTNFWTAGQAGTAGAIKCINTRDTVYSDGSGIPAISTSSLTGTHVAQIFGTNLIYSDALGTNGSGLYYCDGTPQPAAAFGSATSELLLSAGSHPDDFAISPDGLTIYIADSGVFTNSATKGGGIQRWDLNLSEGGYAFSYTLQVNQTNGALGLAVSFPASITHWGTNVLGAVLFATDSTNVLSSMVDTGPSSPATALVNGGAYNELLRGIRFGPVASSAPGISSAVMAGAQLTLTVTNGIVGGTFYVLSSTNSALPLADWPVMATNSFLVNGTATTVLSVNPQENQRFYCIKQ